MYLAVFGKCYWWNQQNWFPWNQYYKRATIIFVFWKVLTYHLVLLKNASYKPLNLKDLSKTSWILIRRQDSEGQGLSSIDLDTYVTPKQLEIKAKNKIFVLKSTCFDIQWQIFKYTIRLISHWYVSWPRTL